MASSYSVAYTGPVGNASYPQLSIYEATAVKRAKIFEFGISSHATPANNTSEYLIQRQSTGVPTGGASQTSNMNPLDPADAPSVVAAYSAATGGCTQGATLFVVSVNQQATYRWVALTGKEFVLPSTQYAGLGIVVAAQSSAYNVDLVLEWEE